MNWKNIIRDKSLVNEDLIFMARGGDEEAKDLLFKNNLPFVRKMARKWKNKGSAMDIDDLTSIGCIALVKAFNSFSFEKGCKFSTLLGKVIAHELILSAKHTGRQKFTKYQSISLDQYDDNEQEFSLHEFVSDDKYINIDESTIDKESDTDKRMCLFNKIASEREKELLHKHYIEKITLTSIAKDWGVTRQAVSVLHRKCIDKIRNVGDVRITV